MTNTKSQIEQLLQKSKTIQITNFEVSNALSDINQQIVDFVKAKTEVENKNNVVFEFTPKMLFKIFELNNPKYFADFLWAHSDNPKNKKLHPRNQVFFTSPRRAVYRLLKVVEKKVEVESS